jgi:hypothetical protein
MSPAALGMDTLSWFLANAVESESTLWQARHLEDSWVVRRVPGDSGVCCCDHSLSRQRSAQRSADPDQDILSGLERSGAESWLCMPMCPWVLLAVCRTPDISASAQGGDLCDDEQWCDGIGTVGRTWWTSESRKRTPSRKSTRLSLCQGRDLPRSGSGSHLLIPPSVREMPMAGGARCR